MLDNEIPEPTQNNQQIILSNTHDRVIQPSAEFAHEMEAKQPAAQQPTAEPVEIEEDPTLLTSDGLVPEYALDLNQVEDMDVEIETPEHL